MTPVHDQSLGLDQELGQEAAVPSGTEETEEGAGTAMDLSLARDRLRDTETKRGATWWPELSPEWKKTRSGRKS